MSRSRAAALALLLLAGCAAREPVPVTPAQDAATAPVIRRPLGEAPVVIAPPTPSTPAAPVPAPMTALPAVPADALYVCVADRPEGRTQTVIEFVPKVLALCRKHPEMGPCQYERDICRRSGGRVFAANGQEITLATEAEYDRRVVRVRFRSN